MSSFAFDLGVGDPNAYPTKAMGREACIAAQDFNFEHGNFGAGTGASVGKLLGFDHSMKAGIGSCAFQTGKLKVGAVVAVNACGDVYEPNSSEHVSGLYDPETLSFLDSEQLLVQMSETRAHENTTIGCILTNADLTKAQMKKWLCWLKMPWRERSDQFILRMMGIRCLRWLQILLKQI